MNHTFLGCPSYIVALTLRTSTIVVKYLLVGGEGGVTLTMDELACLFAGSDAATYDGNCGCV